MEHLPPFTSDLNLILSAAPGGQGTVSHAPSCATVWAHRGRVEILALDQADVGGIERENSRTSVTCTDCHTQQMPSREMRRPVVSECTRARQGAAASALSAQPRRYPPADPHSGPSLLGLHSNSAPLLPVKLSKQRTNGQILITEKHVRLVEGSGRPKNTAWSPTVRM